MAELRSPDWADYPGGLGGRAYLMALLEYDFKLAELLELVARKAVAAAGYNPDDPVVTAEIMEGIARGLDEREAADRHEADHNYREVADWMGWEDRELVLSRGHRDSQAWHRIKVHGSRHRRASRGRPVRRRGSRRGAAPARASSDDPDPPGEPNHLDAGATP